MGLPLESTGFESPVDFKTRLGIPFSDLLLLSRALTHRSYLNEHPEALEDNERLEFLGDAVLDFLVGAWLYNHFPEMAEGELTRLRSALVRTDQLAEFARNINLGAAMRLGRGEAAAGGRKRPALLCGTFEALIGAIYLDLGLTEVQKFLEPMLKEAADGILLARKEQDPKSVFQEWAQSQGFGPPNYRTISTTGPDHDRLFEVEVWVGDKKYGVGLGHSKQAATKAAARDALNSLDYY
ncbi:MAG: ribonuclease III [Chloroflexi bacterium]|nr:ribonuclease III [Chloroflexota bacterium]